MKKRIKTSLNILSYLVCPIFLASCSKYVLINYDENVLTNTNISNSSFSKFGKYTYLSDNIVISLKEGGCMASSFSLYIYKKVNGTWRICGFGYWPTERARHIPYQVKLKDNNIYVLDQTRQHVLKIVLSEDFKFPIDKDHPFREGIYNLFQTNEETKNWIR